VSVAQVTREFINTVDNGILFTYKDIPIKNKSTIAIELSRLYKKGIIEKISKGKYYKPKKRTFGNIEPNSNDKIQSFLNDKDFSYETGLNIYTKLGLSSQISKNITIASTKQYKTVYIDNIIIKFIPIKATTSKKNIKLLQILDAIRDIKKIPDAIVNDTVVKLIAIIEKLTNDEIQNMVKLAIYYPPKVKALLGAIIKQLGFWEEAYILKRELNSITQYKLGIDTQTLANKKEWNII
jgi:hypothetical protein